MKKILLTLCFAFLLFTNSCEKPTESNSEFYSKTGDCNRVGAICNDGTRSDATGSGACSHHGGVREWICK